jgi:hypothetical protein
MDEHIAELEAEIERLEAENWRLVQYRDKLLHDMAVLEAENRRWRLRHECRESQFRALLDE